MKRFSIFLTFLSWYIHRFWKKLIGHIFPATKLIADTFTHILPKLPETLHYIYDSHWFPQNFINILEIPSETIQKLTINNHKIEIKNYSAETQPCTVQTFQKIQTLLWKLHH